MAHLTFDVMRKKQTQTVAEIFGVQRSDWDRFRSMMVDSNTNFQTWEDWNRKTKEMKKVMEKEGVQVEVVTVDLDDFELWCKENQKDRNAEARAEYISKTSESRDQA